MTTTEPNDLKKRLLIKTFRDYARKHLDEMSDQIVESITDNLSEYADAIQLKIPQLWTWLETRSKMPLNERSPFDKAFWDSLENEPNAYIWLADLWDLYLSCHQQDQVLYDLALERVYGEKSDSELKQIIARTAHD